MTPAPQLLQPPRMAQQVSAHLIWLLGGLSGAVATAQMPAPYEPIAPLQWQLGVGYNDYSEQGMRLQGPEAGLGMRWTPDPKLRIEGQWWGAHQRYDSDRTGSLSGVPNHEFRALGLYRLGREDSWLPNYQLGLAAHYVYNDLRGQTSTNARGYERISEQWWLPLRWQSTYPIAFLPSSYRWQYDAAWLLHGKQISRLSEVGNGYADASNTQRKGLFLQISAVVPNTGAHWEPFVRFTRITRSDNDVRANQVVYEPSNNRLQLGVSWVW